MLSILQELPREKALQPFKDEMNSFFLVQLHS
jgi:hypothetical protein